MKWGLGSIGGGFRQYFLPPETVDIAGAAGAEVVIGVDAGMTRCRTFQIEDGIDVINRIIDDVFPS